MINKEDANILIVDDIEDNRFTLERRLKRDNYKNIYSVDGGQAALDEVKKIDFDLILLDLMMPDISGLDVLKSLKSIPIIALSAHAMDEHKQRAMEAGCNDYDTKPVDIDRLLSKINDQLKK